MLFSLFFWEEMSSILGLSDKDQDMNKSRAGESKDSFKVGSGEKGTADDLCFFSPPETLMDSTTATAELGWTVHPPSGVSLWIGQSHKNEVVGEGRQVWRGTPLPVTWFTAVLNDEGILGSFWEPLEVALSISQLYWGPSLSLDGTWIAGKLAKLQAKLEIPSTQEISILWDTSKAYFCLCISSARCCCPFRRMQNAQMMHVIQILGTKFQVIFSFNYHRIKVFIQWWQILCSLGFFKAFSAPPPPQMVATSLCPFHSGINTGLWSN